MNIYKIKYIYKILEKRQTEKSQKNIAKSKKQLFSEINISKSKIDGLRNIPAVNFDPSTIGQGLFGIGLLRHLPKETLDFDTDDENRTSVVKTYQHFLLKFENINNISNDWYIKKYIIFYSNYEMKISDVSKITGISSDNITGIYENDMDKNFEHENYINSKGQKMKIFYKELPVYYYDGELNKNMIF